MDKVTQLDFSDQTVYIGLDVHKVKWSVSIYLETMFYKTYTQEASPEVLYKYLQKHFPNASYKSVYEAGFCGFSIQRSLEKLGIECMVVHASDVPTSHKEKVQKTDARDSRKLAYNLRASLLSGIHIPSEVLEQDRSLVRLRIRSATDITRIKNRIKAHLHFLGVPTATKASGKKSWTKKHMAYLNSLVLSHASGQLTLQLLLEQLNYSVSLSTKLERHIKALAMSEAYATDFKLLISIPGVGDLTAMKLLTELGDIKRFSNVKRLCAYVGFMPTMHCSGDKYSTGRMVSRGNRFVKTALIESAWTAIRHDPALLQCYVKLTKRMKENKAIVRIARKLLCRIFYVLTRQKPYEKGKVS